MTRGNRSLFAALVVGVSSLAGIRAGAQETAPEPADPGKVADESPGTERQAKLEKDFEETMTDATLEGSWQMTGKGGLDSKEPLTEPKLDKYWITSVSKGLGDNWVVNAKIDFGGNDAVIPVPVRVVWAGDTAVITVDESPIPMIGTYTARVMIHHGFYTGIWYSKSRNYGGVMSGRIVKTTPEERPPVKPDIKPGEGR